MVTLVDCANLLQQSNPIDEEQDRGRAAADRDPQWDAAFVTVIDLTGIATVFARDQQVSLRRER